MNRLFLCALVVVSLGCMTTNAIVVPTPIFTLTPTSVNSPTPYSHITPTPHTITETVGKWNLRAGPGTNYPCITVIPEGTILTIEEERGDWLRVIYPGNAGWVHRQSVIK